MHLSTRRRRLAGGLAFITATALALTGCSPIGADGGTSDSSEPIRIGATIPLSGALAGFGSFLQWGYQHAVDEVNAAGGIMIDGTAREVELTLVDDKSDPNEVTSSIKTLISSTKVDALLGSCTPDLVNPGAVVADSQGVPFVAECTPIEVFKSVKEWTYAWDIFFSVADQAVAPFEALEANGIETNKQVFILHDNGPDGQAIGNEIWPAVAADQGYTIAGNIEFPADNTDFSAAIQKAKESGADIVFISSITPAAISIRKQMAAIGWTPKVIVAEKGAEPVQFAEALGDLADGIIVGAYWDPSFGYPGAEELKDAFESETGLTSSQHIADSYTAAMVLMDAIAAAGSLDKDEINDAIGETDGIYAVGPVRFDDEHAAKIPVVSSQWQDGVPIIVWPTEQATGDFLFPVP
ncbi:amino acid ABC transporter substrate-binding protein [Salinibacterium sp. NSLL150]|uniref:amino acid ABC transporter substrate-binding protein n=1 Tax=unclassified Salinibacterium TaxID=2632331 RepID=UPI0018CD5292|nr:MULTISPECIES: amino acid ABC transporter substrate-binding protein [unclassified Salinibacterium]MBH0100010.1 amino acid ABC transporter substrate-binding protein [Salinibacterium sp. NSLL35]MBH0102764.1 amino acid ABC transporter substrate-binding protein [Salinibacterium sp. NSLL150]MBH0105524.1 amino acid ABC transporter substrate-binding protein [Salinibacterium sp. NSLL16]MBH0108284.1 amino acid ABC transporter substrate-binding protein [Salinibacterium sp. NSLL17]